MTTQSFCPKLLVVLLTGAFAHMQAAADTPAANGREPASAELETIEIKGRRPDQRGADDVYRKNVSNAYIGKEYLERYRINAAGDVLKGLNGVYNMNTRTAGGAITPNIRGITGKGRIPVTVDGTEQTIDVWMNNYGVGDRNYLDPALFRSIAVEKSPALTRGVKSGVGGAVTIRTIEADDIVPEGQKFGFQLKTEFANNSTRPANNLNQWLGWEDYRTLPFGATADGAGGGFDPLTGQQSPQALVADGLTPPAHKSGRDNWRFGGDRSYMAAAAFKTELSDGLAAYSYRNKGNYFAGTKGAEGYLNNPVYDLQKCYDQGGSDFNCKNSATFIPNMARIYHPGVEVLNSNTETKTLLLKNNWHLPGSHRLGWQYMRTDVRFGEINPFHTTYVMNMEEHNPSSRPKELSPQAQSIDSTIRTDTYKLGWAWKPEGSRWVDLQANLWRIKTNSTRHQSGGMDLSSARPDPFYDVWYWCTQRGRIPPEHVDNYSSCNDLMNDFGVNGLTKEQVLAMTPNDNGQFRVLSGAEQKTRVSRTGFDISNRFRLSDRLSMTLAADYQKEKLAEEVEIVNSKDLFNLAGMATGLTKLAGPRGGERREWGTNLVFDWQATDRLKISAGIRYHNFKGFDRALAEGRARHDPRYQAGGPGGNSIYRAGAYLPYMELVSDQEQRDWDAVAEQRRQAYQSGNTAAIAAAEQAIQAHGARYNLPKYQNSDEYYTDAYRRIDRNGFVNHSYHLSGPPLTHPDVPLYRVHPVFVPYVNGKLDSRVWDQHHRFGMFEEKVDNPQGLNGSYNRYWLHGNRFPHASGYYGCEKDIPGCAMLRRKLSDSSEGTLVPGLDQGIVTRRYTEEQYWAMPKPIRAHAWAPTIAVSYDLTDNSRLFARYAQMTRFPSVYEVGSFYNDVAYVGKPTAPTFRFKPERSRSWEIGYSFNFAPYWSRLRAGDMRLTYYRNRIENVIETTDYFRTTQYDRKDTAGLEWQSRIDTGRFFAALGATYRLKQQMCDRDMAFDFDPYGYKGVPVCIEGGYGSTRGYQALQPKYSINLDAGVRLLGERLELGLRGIYHSSVNTKQYDALLQKELGYIFNTSGKPYHWRPSLTWDVYGRYQLHKNLNVNLGITNLTNRYYLDPMSNVPAPGPGRTVTFGLTAKF
ncbi:TonB-dependent receptor domain-containing protein [Eikenella corrodens]|uniref:TonB-dependent receptor n=1 Tax=Eikenella corrodens TaxID=539 RepID=A0A1A9RKP0_EIKCO|nr:TonB-dependent receptor [Eikenella corrodens]OAM19802.1 TonB-dependent receptor [Eikenella corrodens]